MARITVKDPNAFPYWQLTVLGICRFSEPIAFNSILAYSYVMSIDLHGGDDKDASFYSGLLVSAYAVAEALTAVGWGTLSDRFGRKPVVLFGLGGVAISSLILGFAKNYWIALLARFVGGALNGNVSVMQTMVAEMVKNPEHEPAAYATQPFVWTLGGIVGSALGGFLAQPAYFYPDTFSEDGIFGRYPYLLPNLASVAVIVLSIVQGAIFLEETNVVARKDGHAGGDVDSVQDTNTLRSCGHKISVEETVTPILVEETPLLPAEQSFVGQPADFGTMHSIDGLKTVQSGVIEIVNKVYTGPVWNRAVIVLIIALTIFSYHQMAFGALIPVHLLDDPRKAPGQLDLRGGFGYTLHDVSKYLTVNGVISLFVQAFVFPIFVRKVGIWYSFVSMAVFYPIAYLVMPFLSAFPSLTSAGIYLSLTLQAFFGIIIGPSVLILLKDATPSSQVLGRVNGMAMSACCVARTISPPLAGVIYSAAGSGAAWFSCAGVALIGALQLLWIPRVSGAPDATTGFDEEG